MVSQNESSSPAAELNLVSAQKVLEEEWEEQTAGNRHGTWWYAAFHYVTAMVGAGVLSLPYAMSYFGWGPGVLVLLLSWGITLYTSWQLIQLHEHVPGKRFSRYHELGQYALGPKLGLWVVLPQQLIVQLGCDIVYMVTGGKSLQKFADIISSGAGTHFRQSYWICLFGAIHVFLSQLPNFDSVAGVSLAAAIMSLGYSTISWVACLKRGRLPNVSYAYRKASTTDAMFRVFSALGQISFTYAGHVVLLEVQATIPSSPEKPSKTTMWRGSFFAYIIAAFCYFPTALIGYWAFGQDVEDNVLISLGRPAWLVAAANLMVVVHVVGSYQVHDLLEASKTFDRLKDVLDHDNRHGTVKKAGSHSRNLRRVRQGLDLIKVLFEQFLSSKGSSLKEPAARAYAQVCAPFHSWAVRKTVAAGMYALPTREQLLVKLNETEYSVVKKMKRYIDASEPIIRHVDMLFLSKNISLDW